MKGKLILLAMATAIGVTAQPTPSPHEAKGEELPPGLAEILQEIKDRPQARDRSQQPGGTITRSATVSDAVLMRMVRDAEEKGMAEAIPPEHVLPAKRRMEARERFAERVAAGEEPFIGDEQRDEMWAKNAWEQGAGRVVGLSFHDGWHGAVPVTFELKLYYEGGKRMVHTRNQPSNVISLDTVGLSTKVVGWELTIVPEDEQFATMYAFAGEIPYSEWTDYDRSALRAIFNFIPQPIAIARLTKFIEHRTDYFKLGHDHWPPHYPENEWRGLRWVLRDKPFAWGR
jgi:hypothetical protein